MTATPLPRPSPYPGGSAIARLPDGSLLYSTGIVGPSEGEGAYPERLNGVALNSVYLTLDRVVACGLDSIRGRGLSEPAGRLICKTVRDGIVEDGLYLGGRDRFLAPWDMLADSTGVRLLAIRDDGVSTIIEARRGGRSWELDSAGRTVAALLLPLNQVTILRKIGTDCEWRRYRLADDGTVTLVSNRREPGEICRARNSRVVRDVSNQKPYVLSISSERSEVTTISDDGAVSRVPISHKPLRIVPTYMAAVDGHLYFDDGANATGRRIIGVVNLTDGGFREIVLPDAEIYRRQRGLMAEPAGVVWAMFLHDDWMTIRLATEDPVPGER